MTRRRERERQEALERDASDSAHLKDCVLERLKAFQDGTKNLPECAQDLWRVIDEVYEQRGRLRGTALGRFACNSEPAPDALEGVEVLTLSCVAARGEGAPVYYVRIPAETAHGAHKYFDLIAGCLGAALTDWSFNC